MELKQIEIEHGAKIPFIDITNNLGRAEFIVCPIYKYGCLKELFIYRKQQENREEFYHWESLGRVNRELNFQGYQDLNDPKAWRSFYCKEHKTQSIEMYVPNGAKFLWFTVYSFCVTIGFTKD